MADQLQIRGGDTASNSTFTGAQRELSIDTSKNQLIVHDGVTPGGHPLLNEKGGNMTGDLTLGTDKITLDASDGSATFKGRVKADTRTSGGNAVYALNTTTSIDDATVKIANGGSPGGGSIGYLISGLGVNSDKAFNIKNDGSAEFAGGDIFMAASGNIRAYGYTAARTSGEAFRVDNNGTQTAAINADGSGTFAGPLIVGSDAPASLGTTIYPSLIDTRRDDGAEVFECFSNGNTLNDRTIILKANGSGEFASDLTAQTLIARPSGGGVYSSRSVGGTSLVWRAGGGDFDPDDASTYTSTIAANGSASFAGGKALITSGGSFLADSGGNASSDAKVTINATGSATFESVVKVSPNVSNGTLAFAVGKNNGTSITSNGSATFTGTVTATVVPPSDARFKENITPAKPQLADVVALGGLLKNYDWNEDAPVNDELRSQRQLGLIAQEAEEICPGIVKDLGSEEDGYKGISHDALLMKLIGAVAELKAEIEQLKSV